MPRRCQESCGKSSGKQASPEQASNVIKSRYFITSQQHKNEHIQSHTNPPNPSYSHPSYSHPSYSHPSSYTLHPRHQIASRFVRSSSCSTTKPNRLTSSSLAAPQITRPPPHSVSSHTYQPALRCVVSLHSHYAYAESLPGPSSRGLGPLPQVGNPDSLPY